MSLRHQVKTIPALKTIRFQGRPLAEYITLSGMLGSVLAAIKLDFDPVALNHGIQRVKFPWHQNQIVWSHSDQLIEVIEHDEIITELEQSCEDIKTEILQIIQARETFPDSNELTNEAGHWTHLNFYHRDGQRNEKIHEKCPKTSAVLDKLPINLRFGFCMVSVLEPKTHILAHSGSSTLRQRYHLCLESLEPKLSKIRIGKKWISWEPGRAFGFNDAIEHEVKHDSNSVRVVLIVDTWPSTIDKDTIDCFLNNPEILNFGVINRMNSPVNIRD